MLRAVELAAGVRATTSPNPWVGCVIVAADGRRVRGRDPAAGRPPRRGRRPAAAGAGRDRGRHRYVTLEPCSHHGRTAAVRRRPRRRRRRAGSSSASRTPTRRSAGGASTGCGPPASTSRSASPPTRCRDQLAPYLTHRTTGRPYVVLKLAATPRRPHRRPRRHAASGSPATRPGPTPTACGPRATPSSSARAPSGPTTPTLTVAPRRRAATRCGSCSARRPPGARVHPALELERRPRRRARRARRRAASLQVLVEGGATVAGAFHRAGLVDRYVLYLAPALFGGDDAHGAVRRAGRRHDRRRLARAHRRVSTRLGDDLRVDLDACGGSS